MTRGGKREGAGGKPAWKHGRTKPVRVPIVLADAILEIARVLDSRDLEDSENIEKLSGSQQRAQVIDLTGIAIRATKDGPVVYLADLIRAGYTIKPEQAVRNLREPRLSSLSRQVRESIEALKYLEGGS